MASLFDQYEQDSQQSVVQNFSSQNILSEDEEPIFQKQKINITPPSRVTHLAVSNGYLVLAMANSVLLRLDLNNHSNLQEVELNKSVPGVKLTGLFLDPSGHHLLVSFSTELLYIHRRTTKPKPTSKLRGHEITAVGWSSQLEGRGDNSSSKPLLVGTSKGIIFELEINADESIFTSSIEDYCKQVFDIGKGKAHAITGLQYHKSSKGDQYFVIATTVDRLYQFVGKANSSGDRPLLQQLFNKYLNKTEGFQEIPSTLKYSCLQLHSSTPRSPPNTLAWLTVTGIFYSHIDPSIEDNILTKTRMLSFPNVDVAPLGFVITDFHILLLYHDHISGISILSEELIFHDYYNEAYGKLVNITKDPVKGTVWVFAEGAVFRYKVINEDRNVWQIYLERGEFEMAKRYCKNNPANMDQVLVKQADAHFNKKEYEESAKKYAETLSSFEEIALKFLQASQNQALKIFLKKKLNVLKIGDKAQVTMLVLWILELLLSQLGGLRNRAEQNTVEYRKLQSELEEFLSLHSVQDCVRSNKSAVYDLMASHGDVDNLIKLAKMNKDYERVINHYIHKGDYRQAVEVLREQGNEELWYSYAPTLIQAIPRETLNSVMSITRPPLKPARLLPALLAASSDQAGELIRYLEFCVSNPDGLDMGLEQAVHNLLLSLYAQHRPDRLTSYLAMQGKDPSMVNYDIGYGVRVCRQWGQTEACVQLSALLGLWEAAVDLALDKSSVQLAKQTASSAPQHLQRKLWLKIAEHVVKEKNDIAEGMEFLEQCEQIKIEDILPFFSDFVTIDHFKDAICSSLQEYNQHIQDLKEEMEDATESAEIIRNEITSFRTKCVEIKGEEECCWCSIQLLLRPFYVFPCGHKFHSDCIQAQLLPLLDSQQRDKLSTLQGRLSSSKESNKESIKTDIDNILASQCLYCGDNMIEMTNKPFIEDSDYERILKEWN